MGTATRRGHVHRTVWPGRHKRHRRRHRERRRHAQCEPDPRDERGGRRERRHLRQGRRLHRRPPRRAGRRPGRYSRPPPIAPFSTPPTRPAARPPPTRRRLRSVAYPSSTRQTLMRRLSQQDARSARVRVVGSAALSGRYGCRPLGLHPRPHPIRCDVAHIHRRLARRVDRPGAALPPRRRARRVQAAYQLHARDSGSSRTACSNSSRDGHPSFDQS